MSKQQQQIGIEELLQRKPVLFNVDAGPMRMKRVLNEFLAKETGANELLVSLARWGN